MVTNKITYLKQLNGQCELQTNSDTQKQHVIMGGVPVPGKLTHLSVGGSMGVLGLSGGKDHRYLAGREVGPSLEEALEFQKESHSFSM